jgi:hypothetical protein
MTIELKRRNHATIKKTAYLFNVGNHAGDRLLAIWVGHNEVGAKVTENFPAKAKTDTITPILTFTW